MTNGRRGVPAPGLYNSSMPKPLGYFITWGTYGTRLHGDPRGTIHRLSNEYGTPTIENDPDMLAEMQENLKYDPVFLAKEQMCFIEEILPPVCERGHWKYETGACGPDHVHVVLVSEHDPKIIRKLLKRWVGQALSERWSLDPETDRTWWAEGGSIRWLKDASYLGNAINYVTRQRATVD